MRFLMKSRIGLDDTDKNIIGLIKSAPGIELPSVIQKLPDVNNNTVRYRVKTLEQAGWIKTVSTRGILRCYTNEEVIQ
jgi:predicted transcriptional regulator